MPARRTEHEVRPPAARAWTRHCAVAVAVGLFGTVAAAGDTLPGLPDRAGGMAPGPLLLRGPYLQLGTPTSVIVRWRTDVAVDSRVVYGPAVELTGGPAAGPLPGSLVHSVEDPSLVTEHEVQLDGLQPNRRYYYAAGHGAGGSFEPLAGGDASHFFDTPPAAGLPKPTRIWALGDSGSANQDVRDVRDAYLDYSADVANGGANARHTELWLMLGDNAYPQGTDQQYQAALFDVFGEMLGRSVLWATPGNHDLFDGRLGIWPYEALFTFPREGEAGGVPSGTETYYSFDYANIHFVSLDSAFYSAGLLDRTGMLPWLEADLAATDQEWIIAFFHHPPYSKGNHDSDDPQDSNGRLIEMRTLVVPILEAHGVDLVLAGHSHSYERSFLIHGHLGDSSTFDPGVHLVDGGDGDESGGGAYQAAGPGAVYAVAGNGSVLAPGAAEALGGPAGSPPHPAMLRSIYVLGSLVIDVDGNRLDAIMLDEAGVIRDRLTLFKGDPPVPPVADFTADPMGTPWPQSVQFTDASENQPTVWHWDFEDDGIVDSVEPDPVHEYVVAGSYSVRLTVANSTGSDEILKLGLVCVTAGLPGAISGLVLGSDKSTLAWETDPNATGYDVAKGRLDELIESHGDFGGTAECLDSVVPPLAIDLETPGSGQAFFYLVRGVNCLPQTGSYDTPGAGQVAPRDPGLQGAGVGCACPAGDDDDADGYCNALDNCPDTAGADLGDLDGDGSGDICDGCPADPANDSDQDGLCAEVDNCPTTSNSDQVDADGDSAGDLCDVDDDGDAVADDDDWAPLNPLACRDADADGCDDCSSGTDAPDADGVDADSDGHCDLSDTCVDQDGDGLGNGHLGNAGCLGPMTDSDDLAGTVCADVDLDGCDDCSQGPWNPANDGVDVDLDGVCNSGDNCPHASNANQLDADMDGVGNVCDTCTDLDHDGYGSPGYPLNTCPKDNCPGVPNPFQGDLDGDLVGDVCDFCKLDPLDDVDLDFICGNVDNCPFKNNPGQDDGDLDGIGDACDACPGDPANDEDGDGTCSGLDNCPNLANPDQLDTDGDDVGDACDEDDDGDGAPDGDDCRPLAPGVSQPPGPVGDSVGLDKLGLGITMQWLKAFQGHTSNVYSTTLLAGESLPSAWHCFAAELPVTEVDAGQPLPSGALTLYLVAGRNACGESPLDLLLESCPSQPQHSDGDAIEDLLDNCPLVWNPAQTDADGDFVGDACDNCPLVFNPEQSGPCE